MKANSMCMSCLVSKQEKNIRDFTDEQKKSDYMHELLGILYKRAQTESAPALTVYINELFESFWGIREDYGPLKKKYNQLLLEKEAELTERIDNAADPVRECIKYVCAGNYIDFSAVDNVNEETFEKLLEKAACEQVQQQEYERFSADLAAARSLVYLTDNCGEVVLDKLFIKYMKEAYPELKITVIVRGQDVLNDATMEDAREVGLTELVTCIGNGDSAPGTIPQRISARARELMETADVIISKGQGNFESLYGEGFNPYFLFLCKCKLFVRRFGLEQFSSVFIREERIEMKIE